MQTKLEQYGKGQLGGNGAQLPRFKMLLRVGVSCLLLGYLLWALNVQELAAKLRHVTPTFVVLAWVYYAACQFLSSYRWQLLLTAKEIHVPVGRLFGFYMIGMFLNNFLPGGVGGDVVKGYYLYRDTGQGKYAVVSVFLERFTGLLGLSVLSLAALAIGFRYLESPWILAAVGGTALFLFLVVLLIWWPPLAQFVTRCMGKLFPRWIGTRLEQVYSVLSGYKEHPGTLLGAIGLSVLIQILYALFYALVSRGLGVPISPFYFILFLPLVTLAIMLPISVGGLGIREALMVVLFHEVGVAAEDILAVSLTAYLLNTLLSCWGGLLWVVWQPGTRPFRVPSSDGNSAGLLAGHPLPIAGSQSARPSKRRR